MSRPDYIKDIRDLLIAEDDITDEIAVADITVTWIRKKVNFPCIVINHIGGAEVAQLGCEWSKGYPIFSIDVATKESVQKTVQLMDKVRKVLLKKGYEILSSSPIAKDDDYQAYICTINVRLTSTYSF